MATFKEILKQLNERKAKELFEFLDNRFFVIEQTDQLTEIHQSLLKYLDFVQPLLNKMPLLEAALTDSFAALEEAIKSGKQESVKEAFANASQLCAATSSVFKEHKYEEFKLNKKILGETVIKNITEKLVPLNYLNIDEFMKEYQALSEADQKQLSNISEMKYPMVLQKNLITEALSDLFKSGSKNIDTFNTAIDKLKAFTSKYPQLKNINQAVINAEQRFEKVVAQEAQAGMSKDAPEVEARKSELISYVVVFTETLANFFKTFGNTAGKLATIKDLTTNKLGETRPIGELVNDDVFKNISTIVQKQLVQPGFWQTVKSIVSQQVTPQAAMAALGVRPEMVVEDIKNLTPKQLADIMKEGQTLTVPAVQQTPTNTAEPLKTMDQHRQEVQQGQPATGNVPAQSTTQGTQQTAAPTPEQEKPIVDKFKRALRDKLAGLDPELLRNAAGNPGDMSKLLGI
jgi:hypothetical protein